MTVAQWLEKNVDQLDRRGLGVGPMAPFALAVNVSASPWRAVVSHGGGFVFSANSGGNPIWKGF